MPRVTIFSNPRRGRSAKGAQVLSNKALEICYIHAEDGKPYKHKFRPGVTIEFLPDGSARLYRKDRKPVWGTF